MSEFKKYLGKHFSIYKTKEGYIFTNIHKDLSWSDETPLQSSFAKEHVGAMPHRAVPLNKIVSGSFDTIMNRPEAFRISAEASVLITKVAATAVDAIDITGYIASNADASFTIAIPTSAGGLGGTAVTFLFDEDKDDITQATAAANTITIGTFDASETDALVASFLINAINGVTAGRFIYASSGNGQAGHDLGITAKQGSSDTQITLTMDTLGSAGNVGGALASVSGVNIIDVTDFTGGAGADINVYPPEANNDGALDLNLPRSVIKREEPRRIFNIRNIKNRKEEEVADAKNREALGNFTKNWEVINTSGRRDGNVWFARSVETTASLQELPEVPVLRTTASDSGQIFPDDLGHKDFELLKRRRNESVFAERFSAPGGYEVMSRGYLDRQGEEVSPYNSLSYRNLFVLRSSGSMANVSHGAVAATAVDCIDTTGYIASNADASFTIAIPTSAGGLGGTAVTILLDEDKDDVSTATAAANTITIGTSDASETDALAASFLINAINGVTAGRFIYASSGNGQAGHDLGITAKQGSSDTQITLTMDHPASAGNIAALASVSGVDIIDVTAFTGGTDGFSNRTRFSGTVNIDGNEATKHDGLYTLLARHAGQFGVDSVYGKVRDLDYHTTASFHKVPSNRLRRIEFIGEKNWPEHQNLARTAVWQTGSVYDNWYVNHAIPRSDFQYSWITASILYDVLADGTYGHTRTGQNYDGYVSTSAGWLPTITFVSQSDFGSFIWDGYSENRFFGLTPEGVDLGSNYSGRIATDFAGINFNIYEPLTGSSNTLGYPEMTVENKAGTLDLVTLNYVNQYTIAGTPANGDETLFKDTGGTEDTFAPGISNGVAAALNAILLHRNGPYQYPTWKQIRTGEHPIARYKRRNNILDIPEIKRISEAANVLGPESYKNSNPPTALYETVLKQYIVTPVTDAYPPVIQSVLDSAGNEVALKYSYGNNLEHFPIDELDIKFSWQQPEQVYDHLVEEVVNKKLMAFNKLTCTETIFPREENQFLAKARKRLAYSDTSPGGEASKTELSKYRMGQQRIFWRDKRSDRQLHSDYAEKGKDFGTAGAVRNSMGYPMEYRSGGTSSFPPTSQPLNVDTLDSKHGYWSMGAFVLPARSMWPLDSHQMSGSRHFEYSGDIAGSSTGHVPSASNTIGELLNPLGYITVYSAINGFNAIAKASTQANYFAPTTASQLYMYPTSQFMYTKGGAVNSVGTENWHNMTTERFWRTPEFSGKRPWYDSYEDYADDIKYMAKDHSVIPEFRISEHMDHYVANGFSFNNRFLTLEGAGVKGTVPGGTGNPYKDPNTGLVQSLSASANNPEDTYNQDFFKVYSHSDFMKHFGKISDDYEEIAKPSSISLRCHGLKKLLPYQGFYPVLRCVQLGSFFSQSYGPFISGSNMTHATASALHLNFEGSDDAQHLMSLLQSFYAPGIMYNTIKSGVAVDYPVVTGAAPPSPEVLSTYATSFLTGGIANSVGAHQNKEPTHVFNYRMPFEAIIQPHDHLPISSSITDGINNLGKNRIAFVWPQTGSHMLHAGHIFFDWDGRYDNKYSLAAHNFFAEVPKFFLKNSTFKAFTSAPESTFKSMKKGTTYYMDVELYKSDKFIMTQGISNVAGGDIAHLPSSLHGTKVGYEVLEAGKLHFKGAIYGPASQYYSTASNDVYANLADPAFAPFTPPYFYGRSIARLAFTPEKHIDMVDGESRVFTLDEILAGCKIENGTTSGGRYDARYTLFSSSNEQLGKSYDGDYPAGLSRMNISASVNLFGKTREKAVEYDLIGGESIATKVTDPASTDFDRWVISTKFETPILDFSGNNVTNLCTRYFYRSPNNTVDEWVGANQAPHHGPNTVQYPGTNLAYSWDADKITYGFSGSVALKGMWSGYGTIPKTSKEGIFLGVRESFPEQLSANSDTTGSLVDVCGFKPSSQRLGEVAKDYEKEVFEAIVAIPFVQSDDKREFFEIKREYVDLILGKTSKLPQKTPPPGKSIVEMVQKLQKYVLPPHMDFIKNSSIDPFAMYVFEFSHKFKQDELRDIWQNIMPEIAMKAEEQEVIVSHDFGPGEFFGGGAIPPDTRWMIFKIKQRAATNYFEATADSTDDARFKFQFQVGEEKVRPDYSYNWPYDFFSLVELAKIDTSVNFLRKN